MIRISEQVNNTDSINNQLSKYWNCVYCSALWNLSKSEFCKVFTIKKSDDVSISITSRNKGGFLLPSQLLYDFGKWVIDRFINLFSLSGVHLCSLPNIIEKVNNAYITNKCDPPK